MPKDVRQALQDVAMSQGQLSEAEALKWLQMLDQQGRYQVETWW
jgi:sulfite reductase alpha subunit-like flavoprotein